jgi:hypothetical protein
MDVHKLAKVDKLLSYIDNGFYSLSAKYASQLCKQHGKKLPRHGYAMTVNYKGHIAYIERTFIGCPRQEVWGIHFAR